MESKSISSNNARRHVSRHHDHGGSAGNASMCGEGSCSSSVRNRRPGGRLSARRQAPTRCAIGSDPHGKGCSDYTGAHESAHLAAALEADCAQRVNRVRASTRAAKVVVHANAAYVLYVLGVALVLQAPAASAYLLKSHLHWERIGAFPHYITTVGAGQATSTGKWPAGPVNSLCYNGAGCGKNTPDYLCNPDCGNPNIGLAQGTDNANYPKAFLIRFVIDIVVDVSLWSDIFKNIPPKLGEIAQIGTLCRDINMPYDAPDNCETALPFLVMNATDEGYKGYLYLQHTSYFDYAISTGINNAFYARLQSGRVPSSDGVLYNFPPDYTDLTMPFNLTVGYNFSAGKRGFGADALNTQVSEYTRCPFSTFISAVPNAAQNQNKNPACYCLTARCFKEDEEKGTFGAGGGEWSATSMVTFYPDFQTFRMGVTPNTQHHAPRIFAPPVMYLPLLQPLEMGVNISIGYPVAGADEDGMTILEWASTSSSVLTMEKDGKMTMPALAYAGIVPSPWPSGWADWYRWFHWKVRVTAIDRATEWPVTTTMTFTAKLCTASLLAFVPIFSTSTGVSIPVIGGVQTTYVQNWGPSCVDAQTLKRLRLSSHTEAECTGISGASWFGGAKFYTKADTLVECVVDQACEFKVHAVRLDFETANVSKCLWSDQKLLGSGDKYCHDLTKGPQVGVVHDAFHVSYTGEHQHGENIIGNPGVMVIKPFRARNRYPNPYPFDIGRREVFCLTSTSNDTGLAYCPSLPHCVTVLVKGRQPVVTSPVASPTCTHRTKQDASEYLKGECPDLYACWRADTVPEITLSAEDADIGETVTIAVDSISTYTRYSSAHHNLTNIAFPKLVNSGNGGVDINNHCRDRVKDPNESPPTRSIPVSSFSKSHGGGGTPPLATVIAWGEHHCGSVVRKVTFLNDYADTGLSPLETKVTPLGHRYTSVKNDSIVCYTVSDNQAEVWGRGVNNKYSRCHVLRLRGAPVFQYSPQSPLDTPFGAPNSRDIGLSETTLTARLSEMTSFTFRARDPNAEDAISIMFLEDPGIPNEATLGPQVCVDYGSVENFVYDGVNLIPRTYSDCSGAICQSIPSVCNEAHRTFSWIPTPGTEGKTFTVCAIAKDAKEQCGTLHTRRPDECPWKPTLQFLDTCVVHSTVGASKRSTLTGFYGSEHCVKMFVTAPNPRWDAGTVPTEAGVNKLAHVGCDIVWKVAATDLNNYTMHIEVDENTPMPPGSAMTTFTTGVTAHHEFRWTPQRGQEGSLWTICWRAWSVVSYPTQLSSVDKVARARNADGTLELMRRCVHVKVRRCKYCVQGEDTLLVKMKEYSVDMNWLRLWAANGNDDGDDLTSPVEDPGLLGTGVLDGEDNGQLLNIGPIYKFQTGDSLMGVAGRFRTTVKSLLDLNPDILDPAKVAPGQEICMVPCSY